MFTKRSPFGYDCGRKRPGEPSGRDGGAVLGFPYNVKGEAIYAFVTLKPSQTPSGFFKAGVTSYRAHRHRGHCDLCNHQCRIKEGKKGICGVRENCDGRLYSYVYGKIVAEHTSISSRKSPYSN